MIVTSPFSRLKEGCIKLVSPLGPAVTLLVCTGTRKLRFRESEGSSCFSAAEQVTI